MQLTLIFGVLLFFRFFIHRMYRPLEMNAYNKFYISWFVRNFPPPLLIWVYNHFVIQFSLIRYGYVPNALTVLIIICVMNYIYFVNYIIHTYYMYSTERRFDMWKMYNNKRQVQSGMRETIWHSYFNSRDSLHSSLNI